MKTINLVDYFLEYIENTIKILKRSIYLYSIISTILFLFGIIFSYSIFDSSIIQDNESIYGIILSICIIIVNAFLIIPIKDMHSKIITINVLNQIRDFIINYHKDSGLEVKEQIEKDLIEVVKKILNE